MADAVRAGDRAEQTCTGHPTSSLAEPGGGVWEVVRGTAGWCHH